MNHQQLKHLESLLIKNACESKLFINREVILFCTTLQHVVFKEAICHISTFITSGKIQSLIICPAYFANYNDIPLTNDTTNFLFYLFPCLCHKSQLKQLSILGQIYKSLLYKRFEALLLLSALESIEIKCFNLSFTKKTCEEWRLFIPSHRKQNNIIYTIPRIFNYIHPLGKRSYHESFDSLSDKPPMKKTKKEQCPLLITWKTTKRNREKEPVSPASTIEYINSKMRRIAIT